MDGRWTGADGNSRARCSERSIGRRRPGDPNVTITVVSEARQLLVPFVRALLPVFLWEACLCERSRGTSPFAASGRRDCILPLQPEGTPHMDVVAPRLKLAEEYRHGTSLAPTADGHPRMSQTGRSLTTGPQGRVG